jgi:hypothetical protein
MDVETFTFTGALFNSFFAASNQAANVPQPTLGWVSFNGNQAVLHRADSETLIDLGPQIAAAFGPVINQIINASNGRVSLTSGPFTQVALWQQVPYFLSRPLAHTWNTQLLRIDVNVHIKTDWPVSDADANISYYIFVRLPAFAGQGQGGKLTASIDGAWVTVSGGWPAQQSLADFMGFITQLAIPMVQSALNTAIAPVANATFKNLYFIPGNGSKSAAIFGDASVDTALALIS